MKEARDILARCQHEQHSPLSAVVLIHGVQREPTKLMLILQGVLFPQELLGSLNDKVIQAWTAAWRHACLQGRLAAHCGRTKDKSTQKWLDDWTAKLLRPAPHN